MTTIAARGNWQLRLAKPDRYDDTHLPPSPPRRLFITGQAVQALGATSMKRSVARFCVAICLILVVAGRASGQTYSGIVVFGDSLSDVGNWAKSAGFPNGVLPRPYFGGRVSNGPLWVERLAEQLNLPAPTPSLSGGTNYAWAGGTTGSVRGEDVNMDAQVRSYLRQRSPGSDELFVLWGGANDFFLRQTHPAAPVAFIRDQVLALSAAGAENFLVVNLPRNFGNSSLNSGLTPHAEQFNSLLALALDEVRSTHEALTIIEFDYYGLFQEVRADPTAFGFRNSVNPACLNCATANQILVPNPDEYFFWDDVHPSAAAHRLIGEAAYAVVVPEPSSLLLLVLGAVAGILTMRRFAFSTRSQMR